MSINRQEIGSEFWLEDNLPQTVPDRDGIYVLSGRTAIDLIIQDIVKNRTIQNVYMPAWCCDSMLAPFVAHGIHVDFYDILFDGQLKGHIDYTYCTDVFYVTNYFGYENTLNVNIIRQFKAKGSIILYDRTHSFLIDNDPFVALADYSFASIRKWMGVIGGAVVEGVQNHVLETCPYLSCRTIAMRKKWAYLAGDDSIDKQEFLRLYGEFAHCLAYDYSDYAMDDMSYAIYKTAVTSTMKIHRRENAQYLHDHLSLRFLSPLTNDACPLFVPVLFDTKEKRDHVRKKLIEAKIYCPVHWPKPALVPAEFEVNKIYDTEISLICDQRYSFSDMQRIVDVIGRA